MSPTARTLQHERAEGWVPWVVERWVQYPPPGHRLDLWNFGDILQMRLGAPHTIVQTTTATGLSARVKKILAEPRALLWLRTGGRILVHGWATRLVGKRRLWTPGTREITAEEFDVDRLDLGILAREQGSVPAMPE